MRRFFGSIRFRMVSIYIAVMILAFVAVSSIVGAIVESFLVNQRVQSEGETVRRLCDQLTPSLTDMNIRELYFAASESVKDESGRILILDQNAVVQLDTASVFNGYRYPCREVRDILVSGKTDSYGFHAAKTSDAALGGTEWVVYYTVPMTYAGEPGVFLFSTSIQDVVDSVTDFQQNIFLVFSVFAVIVGIISFMVSSWLTKPIQALTNAIQRVGAQGYSERVPVRGKDELAEMSEAFNIMSEKLENHDRLRNEFVSNASHELKTPLSTMKVLAESMLYQGHEPDAATAREFFEDINNEIDRLTLINNDLLRLVREENAADEIAVSSVDLEALVSSVIKRLMPLAKKKGIRLERKLSQLTIQGDSIKLDQVVTNLIDNALKYTDKGSIAVTLKQDGAYAVLTVHDTGIGIPKEAVSRVFERFYRVDKARSRDTGGTGLGLSIVERIVALHGGFIAVDSVPGRGTKFTVRLPIIHHRQEGGE